VKDLEGDSRHIILTGCDLGWTGRCGVEAPCIMLARTAENEEEGDDQFTTKEQRKNFVLEVVTFGLLQERNN
jgi:hypothetical protein